MNVHMEYAEKSIAFHCIAYRALPCCHAWKWLKYRLEICILKYLLIVASKIYCTTWYCIVSGTECSGMENFSTIEYTEELEISIGSLHTDTKAS